MKLSILEPFKGIEILSTLFDSFLQCYFYTSLNSSEPCSLSCLGQATEVFTGWNQVNKFPHLLKWGGRVVILFLKTNM